MCLQRAESAFDVYIRGERCLYSVCFRFFSTSESNKSHARVARLHKLQHPNTERWEAIVHRDSRW